MGIFRIERKTTYAGGRYTRTMPETIYWIEDGKYYKQYYFKSGSYKGVPRENEYVTMSTTKKEYEEMFPKRIII